MKLQKVNYATFAQTLALMKFNIKIMRQLVAISCYIWLQTEYKLNYMRYIQKEDTKVYYKSDIDLYNTDEYVRQAI